MSSTLPFGCFLNQGGTPQSRTRLVPFVCAANGAIQPCPEIRHSESQVLEPQSTPGEEDSCETSVRWKSTFHFLGTSHLVQFSAASLTLLFPPAYPTCFVPQALGSILVAGQGPVTLPPLKANLGGFPSHISSHIFLSNQTQKNANKK